jgi:hypothetical protein
MPKTGIKYVLPPTGESSIPGGQQTDSVFHHPDDGSIHVDSGDLSLSGKDLPTLIKEFDDFQPEVQLAESIIKEGVPGSEYLTKKRTFEEWQKIFPKGPRVSHYEGNRGVEIDVKSGSTVYVHDDESLAEIFGRIRKQKEGLDDLRDLVSSSARQHELGTQE